MRRPALRAFGTIAFCAALLAAIPADAYQPVLHEYIPPDDREDVTLAATTAEGDLPGALDTSSGVVHAPDPARLPSQGDNAYHEPLSQRAVYRPDRDTRRPSSIRYDDPFVPSTAPFKRLRAFDTVADDYALGVRDTGLVRVAKGGEAQAGDDQFYADLVVDFESSPSVLIPSVGPGARILRQHATPPVPIEVWRDGADNWYARSPTSLRGRVRLVMQVAAPRTAFGGELFLPSWAGLAPAAPLSARPARGFQRVKAALDLSRALSPAETVHRMVTYFRSFVPSDQPPYGSGDIYVDLALSQRGVCRHRAFAFLVTALGLGIPTRMVTNEAHAWVEVRGEMGWQRIDLGGAAPMIEEELSDGRPSYMPPEDAFGWPASAESDSGRAAALRARTSSPERAGSGDKGRGNASGAVESIDGSDGSAEGPPERDLPSFSNPKKDDGRPAPRITMQDGEVRAYGGSALPVAGKIEADGAACSRLRADVALRRRDTGLTTAVGSLSTDERGVFDGSVFLPIAFPVGEYEVVVSTPGDARCGVGASSGRP